jgi:malate dehydrogenase (oxaloacetate-decarboxylating)(NADP+)
MGIPIGKLALYVAGAGIHPEQCLPVMLDMGTNNKELLDDEVYVGYPFPRVKGTEYMEIIEEFVQAVQLKYPKAMIQFEDFLTPNAYKILHKYKDNVLCFNDDIQGTAAVALAGVYSSNRITGRELKDSRIMFLGAGAAATGIADLLVTAMMDEGLSEASAKKQLSFVDLDGLLIEGRKNMMSHNIHYARDNEEMDFIQAIKTLKPHILIGASGAKGAFTKEVIELMAEQNDRPVLFALSNPTSKSECTAEQAYSYSKGKAIFASGSPFGPIEYKGKTYITGQSNNAYIFPGIGLAATICGAKRIADDFFLEAAKTLANEVTEEDIQQGKLYPSLMQLRSISTEIAVSVISKARELDLAKEYIPDDLREFIKGYMYDPVY